MAYLFLLIAIFTEVLGTIALQMSQQFSKLWPSLCVMIFYLLSFWFLSLSLKHLSTAFAYSVWSAFGMVLIGFICAIFFNQKIDLAFVIGTCIVILGVVFICVFSKSVLH